MRSVKALTAAAAVAAASLGGIVAAPPANAVNIMLPGNYDLLTDRYTRASWVWFVAACIPEKSGTCLEVSGIARLKYYDEYESRAYLANGRYTLTVDVSDGLQCPGHVMPTRDTYSWDAVTLAGTIDSVYDVGCFNGPPGSQFWTFALQRL